ncbi:hypothetical protein [Chitinophaga pinensis]|uniref:N-acetyltransferase domain-containing protein n=1 Tax=Chitinophaga pinensis (strain ATCC 43595 / DSM 2588 / LMG 13176 / NBRC 15968 / NCIMB 11800 / UQM 2034) TaxID=485918 RepID=A0A979GBY4_CHIPD|nr:hypothetical protein [Chitinophaga pinensis]ACU64482.1 hypothetical protein Cpin_7081 [Chitinophaga pinensis DSM 2588]
MELVIVNSEKTARQFIDVHVQVNKHIPEWIRPLDKDINQVFDPEKNKAYRQGECVRWILKDDNGKLIGRIAAFVNKKYKSKGDKQPTGGVGFFDCINDQQAANLLFDTARDWLKEKGMGAMDGPINFGERDRWWGLLVEGFHEPLYCMTFNAPYYKELMENYGFQPFFNQICYAMDVDAQLQEKFYVRHAAISADPNYRAEYINKKNLSKYAEDFTIVYNKAWASHDGGKDITKQQALNIFKQMESVLDEKIVWFAYYKEEPIACWMNLPELNQFFKHMNGKFGLWQKLKFVILKQMKMNKKFTGIVFGIVPEFQGKGVDSFMIIEAAKVIQRKLSYREYELQWIGDFNPKMLNIAESLGTYVSRKLTTYRYLFDREQPFERHPILGVK